MDLSESPEKSDFTNLWPEKCKGLVARVLGAQWKKSEIQYEFACFSIVLAPAFT